MNIAGVKYPDIGNGPGCRLSIFVAGCTLNCYNCFNKEAQSFRYGELYTKNKLDEFIKIGGKEWINGLSLLGGDPIEPHNQESVLEICKEWKKHYPDKPIWLWTGRLVQNLVKGNKDYVEGVTDELLDTVDMVIDGPFVQDLFKENLEYRGSTNQRVLTKEEVSELRKNSHNLHN